MSYNSVPRPEDQPPCEPGPNEGCVKRYLHLCTMHKHTAPSIVNPDTGLPVPAYQASSSLTFALPDEILEELGRHTRGLPLMDTPESIRTQLQLAQIMLGWSVEDRCAYRMYLARATAILLRALIRGTVFPGVTGNWSSRVPREFGKSPKPTE